MKKVFYFLTLLGVFAFVSCKKDKASTDNGTATVKYEFITDRAGNFNVEYSTDSSQVGEAVTSLGWVKTVTMNKQNSASDTVNFIVHPPFEWTAAGDNANVTIKISIDGYPKVSNSAIMGGIDHPSGLTVRTTF